MPASNSREQSFKDVFQNYLKITTRTVSVKTLLSERNLKRINYKPYYQRNYVWDIVKQTFFIESVILGTEIPPIILFNSGETIEVIDGRQRFETLKRFKENDFSLSIKGLKELTILNKISFNKLGEGNKEIFLNSNIRIFEFEVINQPNIGEETIDRVKKEIFRRYNTGITPLTKEELDNAKYIEDFFSDSFKNEFKSNNTFFSLFNKCFFPKEEIDFQNKEGLISKNVDLLRRFRILTDFPISTYAAGGNRTEVIDLLYDFAKNNSDNQDVDYQDFKSRLDLVLSIFEEFKTNEALNNKLVYECILWALRILDKEGFNYIHNQEKLKRHYVQNIEKYSDDSSFQYRKIINRYADTAALFEKLTGCDYSLYIKDEHFKEKVGELRQTDVDASKSIEELSNLRLHKPNPISVPIDEIRTDLKSSRYLVRPPYQRQEKINVIKASAIIESIILGIPLPPIFIFRRLSNLKEVVDGQQRLLAIIGFLGEQYTGKDGKMQWSKNNSFKLRGLKILTELEGCNYSSLPINIQDKIIDYVIDVIVIEESTNENFDRIDLFIRLNYKPYPIKNNSFEMWNSIVGQDVIRRIKVEAFEPNKSWFFLREQFDGKPDRMQNEEMITILSFITYYDKGLSDGVIGFFLRQDRITCRLKDKKELGDFLTSLDNNPIEKIAFLESIDQTKVLISSFSLLFDQSPTKEAINDYLNIKKVSNFKRSLQDFYVIWLLISKISIQVISDRRGEIKSDIVTLLSALRNVDGKTIDSAYLNKFLGDFKATINKYVN